MAKIVIIGAGLTGLSAAYHLEKKGFFDFKIFEKESNTGGLCRSVNQDGFTFDFTGHLLHINDPYFHSFINDIVGFETFNVINRKSYIYSHERYSLYPFQINLYGLPVKVITECISGFVRRKPSTKKNKSFPEWVDQQFGSGFARHFFLDYQQKIFAYDLHKITASWTGRFVPSTSLEQIIAGAISENSIDNAGYNAQFFYPKHGGIMSWVHALARHVKTPIQHNFCVQSVDMRKKYIIFTNGHIEPFDHLVSTMPLDVLLKHVKEKASTNFKQARKHLLCNSVTNFNLGINNPELSGKHWIYFPETHYPFYRLGFPHNFSSSMTPPNTSSLYGEFAHIGKSPSWVHKQLKSALIETKKLLHISDQDIMTEKIIPISHAYVIYNFWRERNLKKLLNQLKQYDVYSIGRYGEWKYASMQEAVLDGKNIADTLTFTPAQQATHTLTKTKKHYSRIKKEKSKEL